MITATIRQAIQVPDYLDPVPAFQDNEDATIYGSAVLAYYKRCAAEVGVPDEAIGVGEMQIFEGGDGELWALMRLEVESTAALKLLCYWPIWRCPFVDGLVPRQAEG